MSLKKVLDNPEHHVYISHDKVDDDLKNSVSDNFHLINKEDGIGINDIEWLYDFAITVAGKKGRKVVVCTSNITYQAQNALLKMIENMQQGVYFYFCIPKNITILETLKSRCMIIESEEPTKVSNQFKKFIESSPAERLIILDGIWSNSVESRHTIISNFLKDLEFYTHTLIHSGNSEQIKKSATILKTIHSALRTGAMHKATIQSLAFI